MTHLLYVIALILVMAGIQNMIHGATDTTQGYTQATSKSQLWTGAIMLTFAGMLLAYETKMGSFSE
jgi:hypothetical protein